MFMKHSSLKFGKIWTDQPMLAYHNLMTETHSDQSQGIIFIVDVTMYRLKLTYYYFIIKVAFNNKIIK